MGIFFIDKPAEGAARPGGEGQQGGEGAARAGGLGLQDEGPHPGIGGERI